MPIPLSSIHNPDDLMRRASRVKFNCPSQQSPRPSTRRPRAFASIPTQAALQPELRRVYRIWVAIVELYAGNKKSARIFLDAPNKHLQNQAPVEFIEGGDLKPLEALVEAMTTRQPA